MTVTPEHAAAQFDIGPLTEAPTPNPGGHIHRNWVVATAAGRFLLQSLNTAVFADIEVLQDNTARIGEHLRARGVDSPRLQAGLDGRWWWQGPDGSAWRVFEFVEGRRLAGAVDASAVGRAFGRFAVTVATLPGPPLAPAIPGFHDLAARQQALAAAEAGAPVDRLRESAAQRATVAAHADLASTFSGEPGAVAHGDAKAANVLIDPTGRRDPLVVDLDTTGPAPLAIDAGDLIRSCAVVAAEDEPDLDRVVLDEGLLLAVIGGWLAELDAGPTGAKVPEPAAIIRAGKAICWEQAVRFLTDHLDGDRYYPVSRPGHNLDRARTQLRLLEQLDANDARLEAAVAAVRPGGR